jgi:hypothetical protein
MARPFFALVILLVAAPLVADAGKPDHAGGHGKGKDKASSHGAASKGGPKDRDDDVTIRFSSGAREAYWDWYDHHYGRGHCPPGLAKKHNGCLPPGLAKKRYTIGAPLPAGVVLLPLPVELSGRFGPPPPGYRYGLIDGDVVKLAVGTLLVVDALDGLLD